MKHYIFSGDTVPQPGDTLPGILGDSCVFTKQDPDTGARWWTDRTTTAYARNPLPGKDDKSGLAEAVAWVIETPDGMAHRVLTEGQEFLAVETSLEAIGAKIDFLKASRRFV